MSSENVSLNDVKCIDLQYFERLLNLDLTGAPVHSSEMWNARADAWEKEYSNPNMKKSEDRIQATIGYLTSRGILDADFDVVDVGCGSGRFVAAFANHARHVLGIDISEKMIQYGSAYAKQKNLSNVSFRIWDFLTLDIYEQKLAGSFDLVFSSNTPAIDGLSGLEKSIRMSRKYCVNVTPIHSESRLESRIMREVFNRDRRTVWDGHWFYSMFNILFLLGYTPETTYYHRQSERGICPESDYAKIFMEQMLPQQERTWENEERIYNWMRKHACDNGLVTETGSTCYGRILWDIRNKTERKGLANTIAQLHNQSGVGKKPV